MHVNLLRSVTVMYRWHITFIEKQTSYLVELVKVTDTSQNFNKFSFDTTLRKLV